MKNKKFTFEVSINAVPYNEETCKEIYGGGYDPDTPECSHASALVFIVLNDSLCSCLKAEMSHIMECKCDIEYMTTKQKIYHEYLQKKTRMAQAVVDSYKFVRSEEI